MKKINIGLFGFGVVGTGLYEVLQRTPGLNAAVTKVCIKNLFKKRTIDNSFFTTDKNELLLNDDINVIVELIDDADAAYEIVKTALQQGKSVVSANKKMIAAHFRELQQLQQLHNVSFLYEASCCASIPIIRNLEEYYDTDLLNSISGIINGSTNYILSGIMEKHLSFSEALLEAQQFGFAERNPTLDVEGHDAANKLCILTTHAFGTPISPHEILYTGITAITKSGVNRAREKNQCVKLVAHCRRIKNNRLAVYVLPQFVDKDNEFFQVKNEFNAVLTESVFADKHLLKGKGAGAYPTAAAVLSDIAALRYGYKYEYKKQGKCAPEIGYDYYLPVFISAEANIKIPKEHFESIESSYTEKNGVQLTGIISAQKLYTNRWWQQEGISLICLEGELQESIEYNIVARRSLSLAGVDDLYIND
ncbi:MAG: homoserine dehydrogenase [Ferruginibacter sp.]